jgi:hypothetical protein
VSSRLEDATRGGHSPPRPGFRSSSAKRLFEGAIAHQTPCSLSTKCKSRWSDYQIIRSPIAAGSCGLPSSHTTHRAVGARCLPAPLKRVAGEGRRKRSAQSGSSREDGVDNRLRQALPLTDYSRACTCARFNPLTGADESVKSVGRNAANCGLASETRSRAIRKALCQERTRGRLGWPPFMPGADSSDRDQDNDYSGSRTESCGRLSQANSALRGGGPV